MATRPGTTVVRKELKAGAGYGKGKQAFAGGVADDQGAVAAMNFQSNTAPLTARKSWFFFDNMIVCLGDGITSSDEAHPVETTVMQRRLYDADDPIVADFEDRKLPRLGEVASIDHARWVQSDGIMYYFPIDQPLKMERAMKTGSWHDLNNNQPQTMHENPMLTMWIDHGAGVQNGRYAYAVIPKASAKLVVQLAQGPLFRIAAADSDVHAVERDESLGMVFWHAGGFGEFDASAGCIVMRRIDGDSYHVAFADPTWKGKTIRLTIHRKLDCKVEVPGVSIKVVGDNTIIEAPVKDGAQVALLFGIPSN